MLHNIKTTYTNMLSIHVCKYISITRRQQEAQEIEASVVTHITWHVLLSLTLLLPAARAAIPAPIIFPRAALVFSLSASSPDAAANDTVHRFLSNQPMRRQRRSVMRVSNNNH